VPDLWIIQCHAKLVFQPEQNWAISIMSELPVIRTVPHHHIYSPFAEQNNFH
jgi:hypothetical protein